MIRNFAIFLALCAGTAGGAIGASVEPCAVETRSVSSTVPLADCGVIHLYAPDGEEGLRPAEDVGQGYVVQVFFARAGCARGETQLVVDCADGTAYSFAPAGPALIAEADLEAAKTTGAYEQLARYMRTSPRGYAPVAGWRRAKELNLADLGTVLGRRVALGSRGESYDLACGCKLYNPGSPGAR